MTKNADEKCGSSYHKKLSEKSHSMRKNITLSYPTTYIINIGMILAKGDTSFSDFLTQITANNAFFLNKTIGWKPMCIREWPIGCSLWSFCLWWGIFRHGLLKQIWGNWCKRWLHQGFVDSGFAWRCDLFCWRTPCHTNVVPSSERGLRLWIWCRVERRWIPLCCFTWIANWKGSISDCSHRTSWIMCTKKPTGWRISSEFNAWTRSGIVGKPWRCGGRR